MKKISLLLSRLVLILGVLIALTPCGICSSATRTSSSEVKVCCMNHMDGSQGCCHSQKSREPYCKAMDQTSVVPALHSNVLAEPFVVVAVVEQLVLFQVISIPSSVISSSPPRGILSLRI